MARGFAHVPSRFSGPSVVPKLLGVTSKRYRILARQATKTEMESPSVFLEDEVSQTESACWDRA